MRARRITDTEEFWPAYADILMVTVLILIFINAVMLATQDHIKAERERRQHIIEAAFRSVLPAALASGQVQVTEEGEKQFITFTDDKLLFDKGSDALNPSGKGLLAQVKDILTQHQNDTYATVQVEGHTDSDAIHTERFRSNWHLSTSRATTVVEYLGTGDDHPGVENKKLSATGWGQYKPLVNETDEAAKTKNRRMEIVLDYPEKFIRGALGKGT